MSIKLNEVTELVKQANKGEKYPESVDYFIDSAKRYIKAIKEGRMVCSIGSVSDSGMSRTIKFIEVAKNGRPYHKAYSVLNFYSFFKIMDFSPVRDSDYFRIGGCGMDMIFHTNYTIIGNLHRLGFLSKKDADYLRQQTPPVI